jgi:polysaccharide biosynthesis protein PslH
VRILFVATKAPTPSIDGGRLVLSLTLQALRQARHELCVVAPRSATEGKVVQPNFEGEETEYGRFVSVSVPPRSSLSAVPGSLRAHKALTLVRHEFDEMKRGVLECARHFKPDVIHAEQIHALSNCEQAAALGLPVVLRMQNVESDLWQQVAYSAWYRRPLAFEAARLRRAEIESLTRCSAVLAIAATDAVSLTAQASSATSQVAHVSPYFPALLPASSPVSGEPAVVLSGSAGWWPNQAGAQWFIESVWPAIKVAIPRARLHVFGNVAANRSELEAHAAPVDSVDAFPAQAICIVPLHIASGLRMRILEAWARGLPVIATSAAVRGLAVETERELIVADSAAEFVSAVSRMRSETGLRERLVANGREYLARYHAPEATSAALGAVYARAAKIAPSRFAHAS